MPSMRETEAPPALTYLFSLLAPLARSAQALPSSLSWPMRGGVVGHGAGGAEACVAVNAAKAALSPGNAD